MLTVFLRKRVKMLNIINKLLFYSILYYISKVIYYKYH